MIMSFTISLTLLFVVTMTQERFLAFSADKVLNVPILSKCGHDSLFDWLVTCPTNGDAHLVVTSETIKFSFQFSGIRIKFHSTSIAVEVIRMVWFSLL